MAFDGIVTKGIVDELNKTIIGAKVNKVFEPTKNDIVLALYCNGNNYALNICVHPSNCRLHLTTHTKPNPQTAPNFCMLLRKHLSGSKIVGIECQDLERTVVFTLENYNEFKDKINKKLVVEIMGASSNVILLNENNQIIDCLRHFAKPRELFPAKLYEFATTCKHSIFETNLEEFLQLIHSTEPLDKQLSNTFIGISMSFVKQLCNYLNIDLINFTQDNLITLYNHISQIITNLDHATCISNNDDYYINYADSKEALSINFFIDDFYHSKEEKENFVNLRNEILRIVLAELKKYTKRLENINLKLEDCKNMNQYQLYGELLTANLYQMTAYQTSITVLNYYTNENVIIPLDIALSPSKNAEKYYKKYNKLKKAFDIVTKQKKETILELEYIESLIYSANEAPSLAVLQDIYEEISDSFKLRLKTIPSNKKENKNTPNQYNINGFDVFSGKNNKQNDLLTKSAAANDLWLHTQGIHGSHIIIKTGGKPVDEDTLYKCATIAAQNSKAKHSSNIPVDYCLAKYVKKPSGAKPGMVVYTNYKTIFVK